MADILIKHLIKRFGKVEAVSDVSLKIEDGEFLVLLGPSGCGKSTILRIVAGLEDATSGEIVIGDRLVNFVDPVKRNVAMVFQNYALYPHMTVYKNIAFPLSIAKKPKSEIEAAVKRAAGILALEELLERLPGELSGGQRQRVALARAIVREPQAFLMDEPLSNLDAQLRLQTRLELIQLHQRLGITTMYVTHDQIEAMTMGSRIAVMSEGVLQQIGTPQEVYRRPANVFVATFLGAPPMNLIDGALESTPGGWRFRGENIDVRSRPTSSARPSSSTRSRRGATSGSGYGPSTSGSQRRARRVASLARCSSSSRWAPISTSRSKQAARRCRCAPTPTRRCRQGTTSRSSSTRRACTSSAQTATTSGATRPAVAVPGVPAPTV